MKLVTEVERYVADTHAVIWHILSNSRLSTEAKRRFLMADEGDAIIYVSVMTPVEMIYLQEKGKISPDVWEKFRHLILKGEEGSYQMVDVSYDIIRSLEQVPLRVIPEMPDRLIAATAFHLNLPLITKDHRLQEWEGIVTVW